MTFMSRFAAAVGWRMVYGVNAQIRHELSTNQSSWFSHNARRVLQYSIEQGYAPNMDFQFGKTSTASQSVKIQFVFIRNTYESESKNWISRLCQVLNKWTNGCSVLIETGNEPDLWFPANRFLHVTPEQLADDYRKFRAFLNSFTHNATRPFRKSLVIGPDVTQTGTGFLKVEIKLSHDEQAMSSQMYVTWISIIGSGFTNR